MSEGTESIKESLIIGWGCVLAASLAGGLWSLRFLDPNAEASQMTLQSFWPLGLGAIFLLISFRIGLSIIAQRRFYSGLSLTIFGILIPVFGALWPFALKVLNIVSAQ